MGGLGQQGLLNDVWKYNLSTNQWTWMQGSNEPDKAGKYGTQGVTESTNAPGARTFGHGWSDGKARQLGNLIISIVPANHLRKACHCWSG